MGNNAIVNAGGVHTKSCTHFENSPESRRHDEVKKRRTASTSIKHHRRLMASPNRRRASSPGGITSLMLACQQELEADVHGLIARKKEALAHRDRSGKTALHYCAENKRTTCAEQILSARPDLLNAQDDEGYSALHLAVISGNTAMVQFLVDREADVNCEDNEKHSCVHWATVCGELGCLDLLIEGGANPSTPDIHGAYPLHYAAQMCGPNSEMGNDVKRGLQVLHKLISKGVDVNCRDQDGRTSLLWAASSETRASKTYCPSGSSDAIVALVKAGADVHARDKDGLTALHCAASRGHLDCLETLITLCGAEVDAEDSNGCSALFYAVTLGHADCTNLLLGFGANPNLQDNKGRTAAHCGASKGQLETLRILGQHRTNLWIRNVRGDTPLHEAVLSGRKELVQWLLEQLEGSVNVTNINGRTPLHIAAITNNVELCKILMDHGAFVNPIMKNSKGRLLTPLDAALYRGNRGCAKYLQLHGALPASKVVERKEDYKIEATPEPPATITEKWQRVFRECAVQTDTAQKDVDVQVHLAQREQEDVKGIRPIERRREGILKEQRKPIVAKVYLHTKRRERRPTRRVCEDTRRKYAPAQPQEGKYKRTRIHHTTTSTSSKSNVPSPQKDVTEALAKAIPEHQQTETSVREDNASEGDAQPPSRFQAVESTHEKSSDSTKAAAICSCCADPYQDEASLPPGVCDCTCHRRMPPTPKPEEEEHVADFTVDVEQKSSFRQESPTAEDGLLANVESQDIDEEPVVLEPTAEEPPLHVSPEGAEEEEEEEEAEEVGTRRGSTEAEDVVEQRRSSQEEESLIRRSSKEDEHDVEDRRNSDEEEGHAQSHPESHDDEDVATPQDSRLIVDNIQLLPDSQDETEGHVTIHSDFHEGEEVTVIPYSRETEDEGRSDRGIPEDNESDEHRDVNVEESAEETPPKEYLQLEQDEYSPLSSLRSIESNVKDSGYSDDLDRGDVSSETEDYRYSPKSRTRRKPIARFVVTSGAADTYPLDESEEIEEERRVTPRSASMPTLKATIEKPEGCPRILGRLALNKDMQKTLRRYQLERRLFYELQELKRQQICGGIQEGEVPTVRRMAERFKRHVFSPGMTDFKGPYTFTAFEKYLYEQLRKLSEICKISPPKAYARRFSKSYVYENEEKQGLCVCRTHMCHHIRQPRGNGSLYRSNDKESVRQVILPEISDKRRTSFKLPPSRSKSWDRLSGTKPVPQISPTRSRYDASKSLPSLAIPLPKKIPPSLLSAIGQRLGPDVHLDDTVVVELSSDDIKAKVRHAFTVREIREAVQQWEKANGRMLQPLQLERVLDPEQEGPVTFEVRHGRERNVFRLPTEKLKGNKKWQVIFTIGKSHKNMPIAAT